MLRRLLLTLALASLTLPAQAATPSPITLLGTVNAPGAVSARLVGPVLHVSTAVGLITYDVSRPETPRELGRLPLPTFQNEDLDVAGGLALLSDDVPVRASDSAVGGQLLVVSVADPARPALLAEVPLPDGAGHTATCLLQCRWAYASAGATLVAVDLRVPSAPAVHRVPLPEASGDVHDVEEDDRGLVWLSGRGGVTALAVAPVRFLGTAVASRTAAATPTAPVTLTSTGAAGSTALTRVGLAHGSLRPLDVDWRGPLGKGDVLLVSEESTAEDCVAGGRLHTVDVRGASTGRVVTVLDSVAPVDRKATSAPGLGAGCSAHWFSTSGPLVAAAWFGAGVRVFDASDPRRMRQVASYVPSEPRTWATVWVPGTRIVYALDLHRGIDVLRVDARPGGQEIGATDHQPRSATLAGVLDGARCSSD